MKCSRLTELALQVREVASSPEHDGRRRRWVAFHELRTDRPLCHYAMYNHVWARDIAAPGSFTHRSGVARAIEEQLSARLWKAARIDDDEPLSPTVWLQCPHPPGVARLWGIPTPIVRDPSTGSYMPDPPLHDDDDLSRLHAPLYEEDESEAARLADEAAELVDGTLPVKLQTDELHYGPFEWAVRMRGMDRLLYDVVDAPAFVHRLMDILTAGMVSYHRAREAAGAVDAEANWGFHTVYDNAPAGRWNRLDGSWTYCHAQSAASLSPAMYAEFVQPYNESIASLFHRVYYHGCEDLSAKVATIGRLPNLRLFHIGPWTPVSPVVDALGDRVAYEIHAHPARVVYTSTPDEMRHELRALRSSADGHTFVLKLCDVETVPDGGERLETWSRIAREVVEG